ncbi:methionine aminopeptidase, merops subfamily M24 [Hesseltinella vesiculosa]|uniref:Methionine aminopeptidase n=1 Tax=Hesseltinella vesiculosa TaxID=101127 RepID=A0A1X2G7T1_9FUNG|nr:methionine aminopeptidase, merops subfamily M24 [Hesseltinella vesiculosa]
MVMGSTLSRSIVRQFHSHPCRQSPRHSAIKSPPSPWGTFQRIVPSSLQSIDVRAFPRRPVPSTIPKPPYAAQGLSSEWASTVPYHTPQDITKARAAGQLARDILRQAQALCHEGVTTDEIDQVLHEAILANGAYPSPLNYMGFPKSVCTSVNNIIAHGIPDKRPLLNGDMINVDVTVFLDGYHGDTSATFLVGDVDQQGRDLVACTKETLDKAISICGPKVPLSEIGRVITDLATKNGYSVSEELSGHGIGREFHCLPLIYHHLNDEEGLMAPGMIFTIEPILCQGLSMGVMWPDEWTISTVDGGRSAQFEHTVVITDDGVDVLTA